MQELLLSWIWLKTGHYFLQVDGEAVDTPDLSLKSDGLRDSGKDIEAKTVDGSMYRYWIPHVLTVASSFHVLKYYHQQSRVCYVTTCLVVKA